MAIINNRILGIDVGTVRTGVAISDLTGFLASPVGTISEKGMKRLVNEVYKLVVEHEAKIVVIGHPKNMDGSIGESALRCEEFAKRLANRCWGEGLVIETVLWDERMTTVSAEGYLKESKVQEKKHKEKIDTVAATVILQSYLDSK